MVQIIHAKISLIKRLISDRNGLQWNNKVDTISFCIVFIRFVDLLRKPKFVGYKAIYLKGFKLFRKGSDLN